MPKIDLIIFDWDDTLCLTEAVCFDMENEVAGNMGFSKQSRQIHLKTWGQPIYEIVTTRFPGIDPDIFMTNLADTFAKYTKNNRLDNLSQETLKTLDLLRSQGRSLAVLTSRTKTEVDHLLDPSHPAFSRIDAWFYKENTPIPKPDPRCFEPVLSKFGVKPDMAIYVGDSISDAQAAQSAGLNFVASLESGLRQQTDFVQQKVKYFVNTISELPEVILQIER
jgi:phosphoglycolate phosphatase